MRRVLNDLKIMILANLWIVPVAMLALIGGGGATNWNSAQTSAATTGTIHRLARIMIFRSFSTRRMGHPWG
jgi:hypothetical protein